VRCGVKVKEKYFKIFCRPAGILLNVNSVIYFKFELKLKIEINEKLLSIIVNHFTGIMQKYVKSNLKFSKNKSNYEKRTAHWHIVTSLFLNNLGSFSLTSLRSEFRYRFVLYPFSSNTLIILVPFFQIF
jgi:hypothetical protein